MSDVHYWQVPGRVNVIGEHLDYNGGPVLPIAIDRRMIIKARERDDGRIRLWSTYEGQQRHATFAVGADRELVDPWAQYVAGAVWALAEHGIDCPGADVVIDSQIPGGAGLSSSAAVTCGMVAAMAGLQAAEQLDSMTIAALGRRAENDYVGAPVGMMDQLAVTCAEEGSALKINTAPDPPLLEPVAAHWSQSDLELLVISTGVAHALNDGSYAQRRRECEEAAAALNVPHLSHAGPDAILRLTDPVAKARTQHVITETARVHGAIKALTAQEWTQLGAMLTASHVSLRDDFDVSSAELDVAVEAANEAGALGARMTGGGFGGSAIALTPRDKIEAVRTAAYTAFERAGWAAPDIFAVRPAAGLHRVSPEA